MKPVDPNQVHDYVDSSDLGAPPEDVTTWRFKPLDVRARSFVDNLAASITTSAYEESGEVQGAIDWKRGDVELWRVRLAMTEPDNYAIRYETRPHPFDRGRDGIPTDEFLSTIAPDAFSRMAAFVETLGRVTVEEGKPSVPSSTSPSTSPSMLPAGPDATPPPEKADATENSGGATGRRKGVRTGRSPAQPATGT